MEHENQPVQSSVMFVYSQASDYPYPLLEKPPVAHAPVREEGTAEKKRILLNYGGLDTVTVETQADAVLRYRKGSDGNVQSQPFIQQFGLSAEHPAAARVTIRTRGKGFCLRPRRAQEREAILAQHGQPLIYGANGFYGVWEDLLLEWHGADWAWEGDCCFGNDQGGTEASFTLLLTSAPFLILLRPRYYGEHLGYRCHCPWEWSPSKKPVAGWCSWEACHDQVTERDMREAARRMGELVPYGLTYLQLDDGYEQVLIPPGKEQKIWESWLLPNEKFPGGHEAVVSAVKENGLTPGIWTNAIVTNEEAANTDGLCLCENGRAIRGQWVQFILSCTPETLRDQVLPYYQGLRQAGYGYFKTDALRHLIFDGLQECVRRRLLTGEEAEEKFRVFFKVIREGIGKEPYLLSCWGALSQCVGIADACRVATDANPRWPAIQMQVEETARWFFAQRVLFTIDPDHVCMRTEPEWARMLATFVSQTGGLFMLSDPLSSYDSFRMELLKKTLPAQEIYTGETGPVDYKTPAFPGLAYSSDPEEYARLTRGETKGQDCFGTLWATHYHAGGRRWAVVMRTALTALDETEAPLEKLGLPHLEAYGLFDFWEQRFLGVKTGAIPLRKLSLGETQAVAVSPLREGLTLLGSSRHVSMDTASVIECHPLRRGLSLRLKALKGEWIRYCFYGSGEWEALHCEGGRVSLDRQGDVLWAEIAFCEEVVFLELQDREKTEAES